MVNFDIMMLLTHWPTAPGTAIGDLQWCRPSCFPPITITGLPWHTTDGQNMTKSRKPATSWYQVSRSIFKIPELSNVSTCYSRGCYKWWIGQPLGHHQLHDEKNPWLNSTKESAHQSSTPNPPWIPTESWLRWKYPQIIKMVTLKCSKITIKRRRCKGYQRNRSFLAEKKKGYSTPWTLGPA